MRAALAAILLAVPAARAADSQNFRLRACVKWSKDIPEAVAKGSGLFASTARVDGAGPFPGCDVVTETESFGVGWLMKAWMKQGVYSPCGERLGGYKLRYKGEEWQAKIVSGLDKFLEKNSEALARAKACAAAPAEPIVPPAAP